VSTKAPGVEGAINRLMAKMSVPVTSLALTPAGPETQATMNVATSSRPAPAATSMIPRSPEFVTSGPMWKSARSGLPAASKMRPRTLLPSFHATSSLPSASNASSGSVCVPPVVEAATSEPTAAPAELKKRT